MTDSNYTHIACVVDRSGSMGSCADDMRGGLNEFFKTQAALPGTCLVDYAQFDDAYELVFEDKPVATAKAVLEPRGMTALLDAIGKTVVSLGEKFNALDESKRPGKVIVVIITDGHENASSEWTSAKVKALVKKQTNDFSWEFVFLGANIDAVKTGAVFGVGAGSSLTYDTNNIGTASASLSTYATTTRSGKSASFTDEDRKANA